MSLDLMVIAPHPDDLEIGCGGTINKLVKQGKKIVAVDLSRGEMSSRGDLKTRMQESENSKIILGIQDRINLSLPDSKIINSYENQIKIVSVIRKYRPKYLLVPYWQCRHPDHYRSSDLCYEAAFLSGLAKYEDGLEAFRPDKIFYFMLHEEFTPSFVVDISEEYKVKIESIMAYKSQFSKPTNKKDFTYISGDPFLHLIETRNRYYGSLVGKMYGEAFLVKEILEYEDPLSIFDYQGKTLNQPMDPSSF
ncbi:MAG: bacillithiol biosynthesis deacetylase BshB1 [Planctomycetota bacterium]|nr:MAG: bacillithiol biosynthesis deacetylase BshB1 [Planctomycetota bacterium]